MGVGPKYPPEVDEAIWTLLVEGLKPVDIRRRLAAGDAGLEVRYTMPPRTLFSHIKRLREDRGDPRGVVLPGQEIDAAQAIRRRGLEWASRELAKLEDLQRNAGDENPLLARHSDSVRKLVQLGDEIKRREDQAKRAPANFRERGTETSRLRPRRPLLETLRKAEDARLKESAPAPDESETGAQGSPGSLERAGAIRPAGDDPNGAGADDYGDQLERVGLAAEDVAEE